MCVSFRGMKFECIPNEHPSEIINEKYIFSHYEIMNNNQYYCNLSSQLLLKLKEIIKSYCLSSSGEKHTTRYNLNTLQVRKIQIDE